MDGDLSPAESGSGVPPPSVLGVDAASEYLQEEIPKLEGERTLEGSSIQFHVVLFLRLCLLPLLQLLTTVKGLGGSL